MKISNFKKFHKNRGIYENTIMEPVEDVTVDAGQPQSQAQMGTTTKPVTPTKPLTKPVQPGTQNPNQQPIVTPVKAQNQAQGRYSQAQPSRKSQQMPETTGTLSDLADLLGIEPTGSNVLNYNGMEIEQYSENGHFAVNGVDTKTSDVTKAKMYIDKLVAKAQGSQMAQEPKMIGERRSNKKNSKNRVNELTENPHLLSGGMTNVGGSGNQERTDKITTLNQKLASMKGQKPGYDTMINQYTEQTLKTLHSIQSACNDIEENIARLMSSHGYQSIQVILDKSLTELNKLSSISK